MVCYMVLPEKQADIVINDLYGWYQYTPLPNYVPKTKPSLPKEPRGAED